MQMVGMERVSVVVPGHAIHQFGDAVSAARERWQASTQMVPSQLIGAEQQLPQQVLCFPPSCPCPWPHCLLCLQCMLLL